MPDEIPANPLVFVSYSHDTPQHKKWVGEFASRLVTNGIDVILDQWDLGPGDDVPKFMEQSLARANRVLMICTEPYVKKADDGKGGVGYEAMIVTGELIKDLGTSKFIPVVRQRKGQALLPKSVSTRFYIDLSDGLDTEDEFERLLRELHQAPAVLKPALGKNPFAQTPSGGEAKVSPAQPVTPPSMSDLDEPSKVYDLALTHARAGDLIEWRRLARQLQGAAPKRLADFRARWERNPPTMKSQLPDLSLDAASAYAPLMAQALTGIESGREKFSNQIGILEDILYPNGWSRAGLKIVCEIPVTVAFVYQALHGAVCLETSQLKIAMQLAKTRVTLPNLHQANPVYDLHPLTGWPDGLDHQATAAWKFLKQLPKKWPWLDKFFGEGDEFLVALCAYYMSLNVLELAAAIAGGNKAIVSQQRLNLSIPLCFADEDSAITRKAYRLLTSDPEQTKGIWRDLAVGDAAMKELWPQWIGHCKHWVGQVYTWGFRGDIPHERLIADLT